MSLREALARHLRAIQERDLDALWLREGTWLMVQDQNTPIK